MPRFFIEADLAENTSVELTETVFHHWVKVLRAQVGEKAILFNGQGGEYQAELIEVAKKSAVVQISDFNPNNRTPAIHTLLGQVMSKGDRMDYAIQKAVELGVSNIQLLTSERCEMRLKYDRDQKKLDHWQGIAVAACEQCGLNIVPQILAPMSLEKWLETELPETRLVLAPNKDEVDVLAKATHDIALLIGPEGGLSEAEITASNQKETAPVVALSILNYKLV